MAQVMMAAQIAGALIQAGGTIMGGLAANDAAKAEAKQMEQEAGQTRARAQRVAIGERHKGTIAQSRLTALAAAGGGDAQDPTVVDLASGIYEQSEYDALMGLYNGEERARGYEYGAKVRRYEGKMAKKMSFFDAASTALGAGASLMDKYGGGGPPGASPGASGYAGTYDMTGGQMPIGYGYG
jgi:hypothetical protein